MTREPTTEERRLAFEARRFALEAFMKIHLEQVEGARQLLVTHSRLLFTLSLGALAGVVTLFAAALRLGGETLLADGGLPMLGAAGSLVLLITAALLATRALNAAATGAAVRVRTPFPDAEQEIDRIFDRKADERDILEDVASVMLSRLKGEATQRPQSLAIIVILISGLLAAAFTLLTV